MSYHAAMYYAAITPRTTAACHASITCHAAASHTGGAEPITARPLPRRRHGLHRQTDDRGDAAVGPLWPRAEDARRRGPAVRHRQRQALARVRLDRQDEGAVLVAVLRGRYVRSWRKTP
jgi:hypothetical protein